MKYTDIFRRSTEWSELEQKIAALPEAKARGDAFEEFCLAYLKLTPEYQIKNVWPRGSFPTHVIDTFKLHGQKDQGIDLIAETMEGQLWAIQAKFRTNRKDTVPYKELSTFLAVSDRADYRLIISNTETLPRIVEIRRKCGEALIDRLEVLGKDFFDRLDQFIDQHKVVPPKPLTPRPHQEEAIRKAAEHYNSHDRGQLIMACGTGKTLTSVWIAEQLKAQRILVMVPSLSLMRQTISVWADNLKTIPFNFLCVCSDKSVAQDIENDLAVGSLWQMDLPVTTDSHQAKAVISKHIDKPLIVFSTYQSSDVLSGSVSGVADFTFDLTICDEAHRTAGVGKGLFNLVLDDKHIRSHKRLFMTATPRIFSRKVAQKGLEEDVNLFSMSDEKQYGIEFYRLYFRDAIDRGLLSDYKVVVAFVTDKEIAEMIHKKDHIQIESENLPHNWEAQSFAKQIAFLKAMSKYDIKHTISFHSRVAYAKAFSDHEHQGIESVNRLVKHTSDLHPDIKSFHVNGKLAAGERATIMKDFVKSQYSIVSNARCLTEGVDIPSVDGVLFFDPKYRLTDIVQATGRALRLYEGKKYGYLIVPVFAKDDEDASGLLESSDFKQVWSVIKAMRFQDERLDDVINHFRILNGEEKAGAENLASEKKSLEEKLNESLLFVNIPRRMSSEAFIKQVDARVIEELGTSWDYNFGILKTYRKQYPDRWPVTKDEYPKSNKLGIWCSAQRSLKQQKKLCEVRIRQLDEIGFVWDYQDVKAQGTWMNWYRELEAYTKKHGNPHVSRTYSNTKLASWVWIQRQRARGSARQGEKLTQEQIALLDKLNFRWDVRDDLWQEHFEELKEFKKKQGHLHINHRKFLYHWMTMQLIRKKSGKMPQKQIKLLESIGFHERGSGAIWKEMYCRLKLYRAKHGDCNVPHSWKEDQRLAHWVNHQRQEYKQKSLSGEEIKLLKALGFQWKLRDRGVWEDRLADVIAFKAKHGHCNIPTNYPENQKLGRFVNRMRSQRVGGELSEERVKKLEAIGFEWNALKTTWEEPYEFLVQFRKQYPDRWPAWKDEYPKGNKLGIWCSRQRASHQKQMLSKERIALLEKIGFEWRLRQIDQNGMNVPWKKQYNDLLEYKRAHGDCNVPWKVDRRLGHWVSDQRRLKKLGKLHPEREHMLTEAGFIW